MRFEPANRTLTSSPEVIEVSGWWGKAEHIRSRKVLRHGAGSRIAEPPPYERSWDAGRDEIAGVYVSTFEERGHDPVLARIDRLERQVSQELAALRREMAAVARGLVATGLEQDETAAAHEALERLTVARDLSHDDFALALDQAADDEVASPELAEIARSAVYSENSFVQTAAARLLAVTDPALAQKVITPLLERELGPTARQILQTALRRAER